MCAEMSLAGHIDELEAEPPTVACVYAHGRDATVAAVHAGKTRSVRRIFRAVQRSSCSADGLSAILMVAARDTTVVTEEQFIAALQALLKPLKPL